MKLELSIEDQEKVNAGQLDPEQFIECCGFRMEYEAATTEKAKNNALDLCMMGSCNYSHCCYVKEEEHKRRMIW